MTGTPIQLRDRGGRVVFEGTQDGGGGSQPEDVGLASAAGLTSYLPCAGHRDNGAKDTAVSTANPDEIGATTTGLDGLTPWFLRAPLEVATLNWQIGGTGTGVYRLALYAADDAWQPSALLWDSGDQDASDGALQTDVAPLSLAAGRYLVAVCADADFYGNSCAFNAVFNAAAFANVGFLTAGAVADGSLPAAMSRVRAFGAFPDPGNPWDTVSGSSQDGDAATAFLLATLA